MNLTKADTVALWHAVSNYELMVKQMPSMDFEPEQIAAEKKRVIEAKRALRKVNAIRRASIPRKALPFPAPA